MVTLTPTGVRIIQRKPTKAFGEMPVLPLEGGARAALVRVGLPAEISPDAVITSAILTFRQHGTTSGSRTLRLRTNTGSWSVGRATWRNSPSTSAAGEVTLTQGAGSGGREWAFDVTHIVQAWVSGASPNYGWRLSTSGALVRVRGSAHAAWQPSLEVDWVEPGDAPTDLTPGGEQAVSITHPTLTFTAAPDAEALQVQLSTSTNFSAPAFDSGEVPAFVGELDLSTTDYAGAPEGVLTYWRARTKGINEWSAWSEISAFNRIAKATVEITSPGATSDDSTPPIEWTFAGEQWAWRVLVRDHAGRLVADSGRTLGDETGWTPPKAVAREGQQATIEVQVWDAVDRVATTGDPLWSSARRTFTLSASEGVAGADQASGTSDRLRPVVRLSATRANVPDGWVVVRDGVRIHRVDEPVGTFEWDDWTASMDTEHEYRLAPVVNGQVSALGPRVSVRPSCQGIWLVAPADLDEGDDATRAVAIWGQDEPTWSAEELAVVHQPIAGPPIRRVAYRPPASGTASGTLLETFGQTVDEAAATLHEFKSEPGLTLRYVVGEVNIPVNVGDITISPRPGFDGERSVSWAWWQIDEVPWSA